jgi:hypothetical protein
MMSRKVPTQESGSQNCSFADRKKSGNGCEAGMQFENDYSNKG